MTTSLSPLGKPRPTKSRLVPVDTISEEVADIFSKGITAGSGEPLNIFKTIAHHPKLLKRFMTFAGFFLNKGVLPVREREIVILRVGWNCQSVYEFGQHTIIGERVGLTMQEITDLTKDIGAVKWSDRDRTLIEMCDDLCRDDCVSDTTWQLLQTHWNETELVELIMVAGTYRLVSGFLNTMGVELDADTPGWPQ